MPEFFEILEISNKNFMGEVLGIIRFRTITPANHIDFPIILPVNLFEMLFLEFPSGG